MRALLLALALLAGSPALALDGASVPQPVFIPATINVATFGNQLTAAGLGTGVGFSATGVTVDPSIDAATLAKIQAVVASHDPTKPPPVTVPQQVPMWAAQAALKQAGKYDAINAAVLQMEASNPPVFFAWTMGNFASRQSAFIATLASQFGMSDADIDAVFVAADQISQVAG